VAPGKFADYSLIFPVSTTDPLRFMREISPSGIDTTYLSDHRASAYNQLTCQTVLDRRSLPERSGSPAVLIDSQNFQIIASVFNALRVLSEFSPANLGVMKAPRVAHV
jgi:hypothetical protein